MSTYTLDAFWSDLNATLTGNNQRLTFTQLFTLNFLKHDPVRIGSFQVHLQQFDNKTLSNLVDNNPTMKRIEWHALENFVLKYLICIRDFDPWSVIKSIDLFISVFECEALLLNTKNNDIYDKIGRIVLPCFAETMSLMVPLCEVIDIESMHIHNRYRDYPRLTHMSTILLKALNNIRSTPDINSQQNADKIDLLFKISTCLCTVYYKIGSPVLCSNVFSNINILNLNKRYIKKSELVKFRFIMGKYYTHQSNFIMAYHHLHETFKTLPLASTPLSTMIKILKYLIPVGMLVGKVTNISLIRSYISTIRNANPEQIETLQTILNINETLIYAYKHGHVYGFYSHVYNTASYWKKIGMWIPLIQRFKVLLLRNLLQNTWRQSNGSLSFDVIRLALFTSLQGMETLPLVYQFTNNAEDVGSDAFVENVLASVCLNGFLKLKMTGSTTFVASKKDTFPDMHEIILGRNPRNPKEVWLDG